MLGAVLPLLQSAINRYLSMDPEAVDRLQPWVGRIMALHITDWRIDCFVEVTEEGLRLTKTADREADCSISGALSDLFWVGCAKGSVSSTFEHPIEITGHVRLAEALRDIFKQIDVNWRDQLAPWTGDGIAHFIDRRVRQAKRWGARTREHCREDVKNFLEHESGVLVARRYVERWSDDVFVLQHDVDRVAARVKRLMGE